MLAAWLHFLMLILPVGHGHCLASPSAPEDSYLAIQAGRRVVTMKLDALFVLYVPQLARWHPRRPRPEMR